MLVCHRTAGALFDAFPNDQGLAPIAITPHNPSRTFTWNLEKQICLVVRANQHGTWALDHEYAGHDKGQESSRGRSEFARKATPVVWAPTLDEALPRKDDAARAPHRSIGQFLAVAFSLAIAGFSIYILGRTLSGVS